MLAKKRFRDYLVVLALWVPMLVWGQTDPEKPRAYQFSGVIYGTTSNASVPYATIQVNRSRQGILSNDAGFFSIPVTEADTLNFDHVGYKPHRLIVKDYLEDYPNKNTQYIPVIIYLLEDTVTLPTVTIFPYDTPEELKTAVVNMGIPDDSPEAIASRNMDPKTMYAIINSLPLDRGERAMIGQQMYYDYYRDRQIAPTLGFDPIAATRLLQYVVEKAKKKKNKRLNYWE